MAPWVAAADMRFYTPTAEDVATCAAVLNLQSVLFLTIADLRMYIARRWVSVSVMTNRTFAISRRCNGKGSKKERDSVCGKEVRDLEVWDLARHTC
jgi:hypothetical protein